LDGFDAREGEIAAPLREAAWAGEGEGLGPPAQVLRNLLRPTDLYQVGRIELDGTGLGDGFFPQLDFDPPLPTRVQGGEDIPLRFADAGPLSFEGGPAAGVAALELERRRGREGVMALELAGSEARLRLPPGGGAAPAVAAGTPLSADLDQDGHTDLALASPGRGVFLHLGREPGGYREAIRIADLPGEAPVTVFEPLEIDHDGDLDLFVGRDGAADLYLRNNGGGPWTEHGAELGVDGGAAATRGLASADFDEDGDLDLVVVYAGTGPRLFRNRRAGRLADATEEEGLGGVGPADGVAVAELDGDGLFDLVFWSGGAAGGGVRWSARGEGRFQPAAPVPGLGARAVADLAVADFDNDGDPDLVVAPEEGAPLLVRNRGGRLEPESAANDGAARRLAAADLDADGDLDLAALRAGGEVRLLRNEGGERNQWLKLSLVGRHEDSGKNNSQGWYARIEVRTGGRYQTTLGNGGVNHVGLGSRRLAEVLRVIWTNGVAQTWQRVGARQALVERQLLKGSCPFLSTWTGAGFEFHTDLMGRSTLGMRFADGSPAPHQSARDWVLIPGDRLRPAGGRLWLQVTAELWETIFVDRQKLLAVDTPGGLELVVDEAFRPPPFPRRPPLHWVAAPRPPVAARDGRGRDLLDRLARRDGRYAGELPRTRYQGVAGPHELRLEFAPVPSGRRLRLLLSGWIFPTDTSINAALADDPTRSVTPPRLEVRRPDGGWAPLVEAVGLPNGKRKTVVVELPAERLAGVAGTPEPLRLRLVSTMQIYWDAAALAVGDPRPAARVTALDPDFSHLHYRGFSRRVRESPSSPHLFDYSEVAVEPPFPWMPGLHTRFGPVTELLLEEDDRYVVMAAGDELTVRYPAADLPPLPPGWRRDWVLYTDGWVKDADVNTRASESVGPWPRHGMPAYPETAGPPPAALEPWLTRPLDRRRFHDALRRPSQTSPPSAP
ncbi:MAG: CRTAC1 family protein, partial [Thermoanaerobaculia bacterium]|nr:CRTAC1 family protein [Thermoanaerobaculia bacterium]